MKAKIDKEGFLLLERAGNLKNQKCNTQKDYCCGDHCPHFQESMKRKTLRLCKDTTWYFKELIDERK